MLDRMFMFDFFIIAYSEKGHLYHFSISQRTPFVVQKNDKVHYPAFTVVYYTEDEGSVS